MPSARSSERSVGHRRGGPAPAVIAKLAAPASKNIYPRQRLFDTLDALWADHGIVWIDAPGGAGKTSLAVSYLRTRERPVLWYQVDTGDADLASFFYYLSVAAERAAPRCHRALPLLTPEYLGDRRTFARNFFRALFARLPASSLFVLDNYQDAGDVEVLHETIAVAANELPPGMNLLVLSRVEPPASLARLRVNHRIARVDAEAMRLTLVETAGLVALSAGAGSRALGAERLHERSQGWTAGVVLMLEGGADVPAASAMPSERTLLFDYFASEFFRQADAETQRFLLELALLTQPSAAMVQALSGRPQAEKVLERLVMSNYFTVRLPGAPARFRLHPLFQQFLLDRGHRVLPASERERLARVAAELLLADGQLEAAADLFRECRDDNALIAMIETHALALSTQGRLATLLGWLRAVPAARAESRPWLLYWFGVCRMPHDLFEARRYFEAAFEGFERDDDATGMYLAWAGVADTFTFAWDDFAPVDRWVDELRSLRRRHPLDEHREIAPPVVIAALPLLAFVRSDDFEVPHWMAVARKMLLDVRGTPLHPLLAGALCICAVWATDLTELDDVTHELASSAGDASVSPLARIWGHVALTQSAWLLGDLPAARRWSDLAVAFAAEHGIVILDALVLSQACYVSRVERDLARMQADLGRLHGVLRPDRRLDVAHYYNLSSWLACEQGDLPRARDHAERSLQLAMQLDARFPIALSRIGMADVLIESGDFETAVELIDCAQRFADAAGSALLIFDCALRRAWALLRQGHGDEAAPWLARALAAEREHGYSAAGDWHPGPMASLCAFALEHGIEPETTRRLIARWRLARPAAAGPLTNWAWPVKIRTFGGFQLTLHGRPYGETGRQQRRAMDLLAALVTFGGHEVREDRLCDALWPDAEADAAQASLKATLHRLRGLVGFSSVALSDGRYTLDPAACWCDTQAFGTIVSRVAEARTTTQERRRLGEQLFDLYRGPFLGDDPPRFALVARERLRNQWLRAVAALAEPEMRDDAYDDAVAWYERAILVDPATEPLYQGIMRACLASGRVAQGLAAYDRLRAALQVEIAAPPSAESNRLAAMLNKRMG